jgi:hypothetical protein
MKIRFRSAHYTLYVCATAAMLGGCGGSPQLPNPTAQTPLVSARTLDRAASLNYVGSKRVGSNSSTTEVLSAKNVNFGGMNGCGPPTNVGGSFKVKKGKRTASGPYPGTFTAQGSFGVDPHHQRSWSFSESFAIKSGTSTITGTISGGGQRGRPVGCHTFGPARLQYMSNHGSGVALIKIIQKGKFREMLDGL